MFEHVSKPLIPVHAFRRRMVSAGLFSAVLVSLSLAVGMAGFHWLEALPWIDAFVSASMLLSGMGPIGELQTMGGKLFAGLYALYSGFVALISAGALAAPVLHRFLHRFHIEEGPDT